MSCKWEIGTGYMLKAGKWDMCLNSKTRSEITSPDTVGVLVGHTGICKKNGNSNHILCVDMVSGIELYSCGGKAPVFLI